MYGVGIEILAKLDKHLHTMIALYDKYESFDKMAVKARVVRSERCSILKLENLGGINNIAGQTVEPGYNPIGIFSCPWKVDTLLFCDPYHSRADPEKDVFGLVHNSPKSNGCEPHPPQTA